MKTDINSPLTTDQGLFNSAFRYAVIGMALIGLDGSWLEVNDAVCRMFGYSKKELSGLTFQDLTHPDDLQKDLNLVEAILAGNIETYQMEKRYMHKNGGIVWALLSVSLVKDELDNPAFFISQIQNITDKKLAEIELSLILDNSPDVVVRVDAHNKALFISKQHERLFGISAKNLVGKRLDEFPENVRPPAPFMSIIEKAVAEKKEMTVDYKGGLIKDRYFLVTVKPEFKEADEAETYLVIMRDITKKRLAEIALEKSRQQLHSILEGVPLVIARVSKDFRYLYMNSAVERETGVAAELFIGKTLVEAGLSEILSAKIEATIAAVFEHKKTLELEVPNETPNGVRYYFGRFTPEFDAAGQVETVLIFSLDITNRKIAEIKLQAALEQVKQLQGLLPICSYCKNIRDDQDYWHTVESYVAKHSQAKFSHGVCPKCYDEKLLPEIEAFKQSLTPKP